jgi:hypothetical protein
MSDGKSSVLFERGLKTLRLRAMGREYAKLASLWQADRADCPTCLLRLAEHETQDREVRAAERRAKATRFGVANSLDPFDVGVPPASTQKLMREHGEATTVRLDGREPLRHVQVAQTGVVAYGPPLALGGAP